MKITLIQAPLAWENPLVNLIYFEQKFNEIKNQVDVIILPEMFTTGFSMHPKPIAETMEGKTVQWMREMANQKNCAIVGSIIIEVDNQFFNRLLFVEPNNVIHFYNKRHLFSLAGEHHEYTAGQNQKIVKFRDFKFCLQICYDLRFPVFARNTSHYDALIYVANWPKPRIAAWDALLKARAIENMSYVLGVNRIGTDANNHEYCGHSQAIDFMGNHLVEPQTNEETFIVTLDKNAMLEARTKFGFLNDKDDFQIV
jgi:predicted amidohydrolase